MKRTLTFARRCALEILRDPLTLFFGLVFPLLLLFLLSLIQSHVPVPMFVPETLAPGVAVFGLSFISLFAALLIARDRESALLHRLFCTPARPEEFLLGYLLPLLPLALLQSAAVYLCALPLGLPFSLKLLGALGCGAACSLLNIALGLLCGTLLSDRQVGGVCGALLTNLTAWLSGIWFDVTLLGAGFAAFARALPFYHAVEACRAALSGSSAVWGHLGVVLLYAAALMAIAIACFTRKMKRR